MHRTSVTGINIFSVFLEYMFLGSFLNLGSKISGKSLGKHIMYAGKHHPRIPFAAEPEVLVLREYVALEMPTGPSIVHGISSLQQARCALASALTELFT